MASYNTSKIENWYNDFVTYKNKFDNDFYSDYTSSYIKKNYNDVNNRISRNLDSHYNKIKELYKSIDTYWKNLIDDIKNADAVMAGTQKSGSIHSSPVASALNSLPELKEYEVTLDTRFSSFLANTGASEINQWIEENITWENAVVCVTSLYSGGAKVWETIGDGLIWWYGTVFSGVTSIFSKEASEKIQNFTMDAIAFDAVGTVNDFIYQGTELGRTVNAGATMKYDSEAAKTVTKIGQETFEFALSTAVTIATGGVVPPGTVSAVLGLLSGIGESAEKNFQEEDRNFWGDAGEILISGGISSVDWYSKGQIGANVLNAGKMLLQKGGTKMIGELIKAGISQTKSEFSENGVKAFFNLLKNGAKNTVKDVDTWVESAGAAFNNVSYEKENGFQVDWENFAKESVVNFLFNYGSNSLMSKMFDFGTLNAKNLDADLSTINVKSNDAAGKYNENFKSYMASNNINSNNVDAFEIYGSLDEQIAKTNRYIEKGNFVTLHVNSVDDIPANVWETVNRPKIDDKDVVIITKNGEKFYWGEPVDAYMLKKNSNIGEQVDDIEKQLGITRNSTNPITNVEVSRPVVNQQATSANITNDVDTSSPQYVNNVQSTYNNTNTPNVIKIDSNSINQTDVVRNMWHASANGKIIVEVDDNLNPHVIFNKVANPENVVVRRGDIDWFIDEEGLINARQAKASYETNVFSNGFNAVRSDGSEFLLANLGVKNIDGKTVYIMNVDGKRIYSETDLVTLYLNGDSATKNFIANDFLNPNRVSKNMMMLDGYMGFIQKTADGNIEKHRYTNFEKTIQDSANDFERYLDGVRKNKGSSDFGVNQHVRGTDDYLTKSIFSGKFKSSDTKSLKRTINSISELYSNKISEENILNIMYYMNSAGACSYADRANAIFDHYKGRDGDFYRDFGYQMYEQVNGEIKLNSKTLMTDLYLFSNLDVNGGRLFYTDVDGTIKIQQQFLSGDRNYIDANQVYMTSKYRMNDDVINSFLKSKNINVSFDSYQINLNNVKDELILGNEVHMGIYYDKNNPQPITLYNLDGGRDTITNSWREGGGHAIFVTGIREDGLVVSSWGSKHLIKYSDLTPENYVLYTTKIS